MTSFVENSAAKPHENSVWQAYEPARLVWEALGAEQFVFNPASGQTHILNPLGAAVLEWLTENPRSADELLDLLLSHTPDAKREELRHHLNHHLRQLGQLGLIEPRS